jgi:hypothetical protein
MIWFVNSRLLLSDYLGVFRLFRSWGGESLYRSHERHPKTGPLLRRIGVPCIVVAALPIQKFQCYGKISYRILWSFLKKNGVDTDQSGDLEGHMKEPVSPTRIKEIIAYGDRRFEALTRCNSWPPSFRLDA